MQLALSGGFIDGTLVSTPLTYVVPHKYVAGLYSPSPAPVYADGGAQFGTSYPGGSAYPAEKVSAGIETTAKIVLSAGKGGELGAAGGTVVGRVDDRRTTSIKNAAKADYTSIAGHWDYFVVHYENTLTFGMYLRAKNQAIDKFVKNKITPAFSAGVVVDDVKDYLLTTMTSAANLVPRVTVASQRTQPLATNCRQYRPAYHSYWISGKLYTLTTYYPAQDFYPLAVNFGVPPATYDKAPGTYCEEEIFDTSLTSIDFTTHTNVRPLSQNSLTEPIFGASFGAFGGFPVYPCQISDPGLGGNAVKQSALTPGRVTVIVAPGGSVIGDLDGV